MKKILTSIVALLAIVSGASATPINKATALKKATTFLQHKGKKVIIPKLAYTAKAPSRYSSFTPYYVFNAENNNGFVIIAGDDNVSEVLGYSDKGSFDTTHLPDNIQSFLEALAAEVTIMSKATPNAARAKMPAMNVAQTPIKPLLTAVWNQGAPYNLLCPTHQGKRCPSGCVATAMAQVMYKYKWPAQTTATIPSYICYFSKTDSVIRPEIPANSPIDWNNMVDDYRMTQNQESRTAISKLMSYLGTAVTMSYSKDGSGASDNSIAPALKHYFNYDARTIQRENYPLDKYEEVLYNELKAGRPIILCGHSTGGGHCFVIDGHDGNGLFHVNWGWGGDSNGYFKVSILNPNNMSGIGASSSPDGYAMSQTATLGIEPNTDNIATPDQLQTYMMDAWDDSIAISAWNYTGVTHSWDIALAIQQADGELKLVSDIYSEDNVGNYYGWQWLTFKLTNIPMEAGVYNVMAVNRVKGTQAWLCEPYDVAQVTRGEDGSMKVSYESIASPSGITVDNISCTGTHFNKQWQTVKFRVNNRKALDKYTNLYLFASTSSVKGRYKSKTTPSLRPNESQEVTMEFLPKVKGTYKIWIASDYQGKYVLGETTVDIIDKPAEDMLENHFIVQDLSAESTVYGNSIMGTMNVKNNGNIYDGYAYVVLYVPSGDNWKGMYEWYNHLSLKKDETGKVDFDFDGLKPGKYLLVGFNGDEQLKAQLVVNVEQGYTYYRADGTRRGQPITTPIVVPEEAVAVDLTQGDITRVQPNSNPNTLYYSKVAATNENGLANKNVIVNDVADNITLNDAYGYACPMSFTANNITYTRIPRMATADGKSGYEALSLPFNATSISSENKELAWYTSSTDTNKDFWLMEMANFYKDNLIFNYAESQFVANRPYIMAVPEALKNKEIVFRASNVKMETNADFICASSLPICSFQGVMMQQNVAKSYTINTEGTKFVYAENNTINPFRAYVLSNISNTSPLVIAVDFDATLIQGIQKDKNNTNEIKTTYNLNGKRMASKMVNQKGVYIINGKKTIVR